MKSKYGLQLRQPQSALAKKPLPPPKKPSIFTEDDDDEDNVEQAIARQAAKNRALKQVELQHKAALEQDPMVFSYDEVYDDMKATSTTTSRRIEEEHSKPKYITKLLDKAKVRQQEQEIIYERKLLKERQREDHLYGDKDKFVTSAYKKKLAEQAKWLEEERLRELREQAQEVTNRGDLSDFYHNLFTKNIAFGAKNKVDRESPQLSEQECAESGGISLNTDLDKSSEQVNKLEPEKASSGKSLETESSLLAENKPELDANNELRDAPVKDSIEEQHLRGKEEHKTDGAEKDAALGQTNSQTTDRKPSQDALAAAKERFLARKRMRTT